MKISAMLHTLIVIACVVFVGGVATGYFAHGKPAPAQPVQVAVARAQVAVAAAAKAETVFVHEAATSTHWQTVYDTARVHDTVSIDHVVYVSRDVADSTVHSCRESVSSCSLALAAKDHVIASKDSVITAQNADRPSRLRGWIHDALLLGVGYGAGRLNLVARVQIP